MEPTLLERQLTVSSDLLEVNKDKHQSREKTELRYRRHTDPEVETLRNNSLVGR